MPEMPRQDTIKKFALIVITIMFFFLFFLAVFIYNFVEVFVEMRSSMPYCSCVMGIVLHSLVSKSPSVCCSLRCLSFGERRAIIHFVRAFLCYKTFCATFNSLCATFNSLTLFSSFLSALGGGGRFFSVSRTPPISALLLLCVLSSFWSLFLHIFQILSYGFGQLVSQCN
ncbi:hypothetical protein XENOCAPTIV_003443 [Xenoophorus captivus]|uniref:Uncharacterized protein n=1 Tax=Xenoophorus captivus TaxID=1517983 RepID=A0ABV0RGT9_9TELE